MTYYYFNKNSIKGRALKTEIQRVVGYALKLKGTSVSSPLVKVSKVCFGFVVTKKSTNEIIASVKI